MTTPALAETVKGKGRHYRHPVTGDLLPSVTNILSMLNKPALMHWAAREVAELAATMREVLPQMSHDEVVDVLKGAATRTGNRAGSRGTDIHEWLEEALRGRPTPVLTGQAIQYQPAAQDWLTMMRPTPIATETTMFAPLYAGTADAVVEMDGAVWLLDFKTSKAVYGEAALQLAALADGTLWHDGTKEVPTVPIDRLGVVRIGTGGVWELHEVDDIANHHACFIALLEVWHWQHTTDKFKEATDVATV
jgi:hypothetical protein